MITGDGNESVLHGQVTAEMPGSAATDFRVAVTGLPRAIHQDHFTIRLLSGMDSHNSKPKAFRCN
jgi:hypothetical protein